MKEIIIKVEDELYDRAQESVDDLEAALTQRVMSYLSALNPDDKRIAAARVHMKELFNATSGFGVGRRPSREEMHERGSVRELSSAANSDTSQA